MTIIEKGLAQIPFVQRVTIEQEPSYMMKYSVIVTFGLPDDTLYYFAQIIDAHLLAHTNNEGLLSHMVQCFDRMIKDKMWEIFHEKGTGSLIQKRTQEPPRELPKPIAPEFPEALIASIEKLYTQKRIKTSFQKISDTRMQLARITMSHPRIEKAKLFLYRLWEDVCCKEEDEQGFVYIEGGIVEG
jgi:hypothetical protein